MFKHWLSEEDKKINKENGINRRPDLGCFIIILGTILFWCGVFWVITTLEI